MKGCNSYSHGMNRIGVERRSPPGELFVKEET